MLYLPFYSLPDSQTNSAVQQQPASNARHLHLDQLYNHQAVYDTTTPTSSFVELPPLDLLTLNYLSPTPETGAQLCSKQCSPGFDFSCLPTPSPSVKSEGGLAAPLLPWSRLDMAPSSLPPSTPHTFTATLPPPPSQLAKCCWGWMETSSWLPQQLNHPSFARRWSQPAPMFNFMDQKKHIASNQQSIAVNSQNFGSYSQNQNSDSAAISSNDQEINPNWISQRSYSLGAHSLMNLLKPQLQLTDYLVRPFEALLGQSMNISNQSINSEEQVRLSTSFMPHSLEISSYSSKSNPVASEAQDSLAGNCCEFSCIPSTSAQLPSSSGGDTKKVDQYSGLAKTSCDVGISSPSSELIGRVSSSLSLASTSPAIQDPLSPEAILYSKHFINSSFDSFFESSSREDMIIDHLHRRCHRGLKIVHKTEEQKAPISPPLNTSQIECRKRKRNGLHNEQEADGEMDQFERELQKMPRLMPETPPLTTNIDDAENTAPPPMLNPFDSSTSPPSLPNHNFDSHSKDVAISLDNSEAVVLANFTHFPHSPPPSTPSSSGVSSANSSLMESSIIFSTPSETDSLTETTIKQLPAKQSVASPSSKDFPANERRKKYAFKRRRTFPKPKLVEVLASSPPPAENSVEKELLKCKIDKKREKIQPFRIKLKLKRLKDKSPKVEEEKKVPPMKLILPKSQSNESKSNIEEGNEPVKTDFLLVNVTKKKKNRELESLKQTSDFVFSAPKSRFSSSKKKEEKQGLESHKRRSIKQKKKKHVIPHKSFFKKKKGLKMVSNWRPIGQGFSQSIRIANDSSPVQRHCFHSIRHWAEKEEIIRVRDCVKICSSEGLENIGRIMHLHYDESSKGLLATVLWFYTQKQVDTSKGLCTTQMLDKELLASRHIDTVNVDCIESLAFVLTVNEFCRFSAETKIDQLPVQRRPSEASELWSRGEEVYPRRSLLPHEDTPLELVYFCRGVYSLKTKRLSLSLPSSSNYHQPQNSFYS